MNLPDEGRSMLTSLPVEVYGLCDIFCPNEAETELLTGMPVNDMAQAEAAACE